MQVLNYQIFNNFYTHWGSWTEGRKADICRISSINIQTLLKFSTELTLSQKELEVSPGDYREPPQQHLRGPYKKLGPTDQDKNFNSISEDL